MQAARRKPCQDEQHKVKASEQLRHSFLQDPQVLSQFLLVGKFRQEPRRFLNRLEGQFEAAVMHRDEPF
jgi:hypothetical protein